MEDPGQNWKQFADNINEQLGVSGDPSSQYEGSRAEALRQRNSGAYFVGAGFEHATQNTAYLDEVDREVLHEAIEDVSDFVGSNLSNLPRNEYLDVLRTALVRQADRPVASLSTLLLEAELSAIIQPEQWGEDPNRRQAARDVSDLLLARLFVVS